MCSNADMEQDGVMLMEKVDSDLSAKWCRKCVNKTKAKIVLRKKDAYCKQCFLSSVTHKFKACLGKSKTMRHGDKVLIGFSGNDNSVGLLHLVYTGLQETSHKKLMFQPFIIYVDEGTVLNLTTEERNAVSACIKKQLEIYGYPVYTVPLELSIEPEKAIENYFTGESYSTHNSTLNDLFTAIPDVTSKMDLLCKLRNTVLIQTAKSLGCNKVFTAETADDLAIKLLTNVSLGRGAQLPYDVGFSDDRFPEIKMVRPLRDLSKKELAFYKVFHSLTSVHVPSLSTKIDTHSSIQKLTESFLCVLQDGFPSTVSTVFRVADKLTTNSETTSICLLCKSPLDTEESCSSSLNATQFSRLVSSTGPSHFDAINLKEINSDSSCNGNNEVCSKTCQSNKSCCSNINDKELQELLCYSCNLIFRNSDMETVPAQVIKCLRESSQRFKMRKEIEEFLL